MADSSAIPLENLRPSRAPGSGPPNTAITAQSDPGSNSSSLPSASPTDIAPTTTETPNASDVSAGQAASSSGSSNNTPKERRNALVSCLTSTFTIMGAVATFIFGLMAWFAATYANAYSRKGYELSLWAACRDREVCNS